LVASVRYSDIKKRMLRRGFGRARNPNVCNKTIVAREGNYTGKGREERAVASSWRLTEVKRLWRPGFGLGEGLLWAGQSHREGSYQQGRAKSVLEGMLSGGEFRAGQV